MFTRLRKHLGTAGLLVAVVALVAALGGGAVAAQSGGDATASAKKKKRGKQGGLNWKQKRQVIAIAKRFARSGPAGPAGPAGLQGIQGLRGGNGTNGTSVAGVAATVGECPDGGVKYTSASGVNIVCNGEDGSSGDSVTGDPIAANDVCGTETGVKYTLDGTDTNVCNGSPWTAGGTLPSGATETGAFFLNAADNSETLSFPIQLAAAIPASNVHIILPTDTVPEGCTGGTPAAPTADPGHLCVFIARYSVDAVDDGAPGVSIISSFPPSPGASRAGATLSDPDAVLVYGSWAVTGAAPVVP